MRMLLLLTTALLCSPGISAQKLVIGERAPELRVAEWLSEKPVDGRARLVEFFHSSSRQCTERLGTLDATAQKYDGRLQVIVVSREDAGKTRTAIDPRSRSFSTAADDGNKTFEAYGVRYVPYGVLIDRRGRVVWFGNTTSLEDTTIDEALK